MTSDAVAEALMAAEQRDEVLGLGALGRPQEVGPATVMLTDTALAPLAARALTAAVDAEPSEWSQVAVEYTTHLGEQTSYLALGES